MQPFHDIRVLDLTHVLAGPFAAYQLAVLGADVIKIECPHEPDIVRTGGATEADDELGLSSVFVAQNANKRALTLNLKSTEGRDVLKRLIAGADVLVENYRAGALTALGLGYDDACLINPKLVYCSLTGFGQDGPKAGHTAYDNVVQAFSGLMATTGTGQSGPTRVGSPVLDYGTGAQAALAIAAALYRRRETGKGEHIDIAMFDAAIMLMGMHVTQTTVSGRAPQPNGNDSLDYPGYCCFPTRRDMLMVGAFSGRQHADMWRALGDPERAEQVEGLTLRQLKARRGADHQRLGQLFLARPADEWEQILNANKVPAARVRTLEESLAEGQLRHRGVLQTIDSPVLARSLSLPVAAYTFTDGGPVLHSPPPVVGQHTTEILTELDYTPQQIEDMKSRGVI